MDIGGEEVAEGVVDQPVPGQRCKAPEARRGNPHVEMAPAVPGTLVSDVQVTLVLDLEQRWLEGGQALPDQRQPVRAGRRQGITAMKGLTLADTHTPAAR